MELVVIALKKMLPDTIGKTIVWWLAAKVIIIVISIANPFSAQGDLYYYFTRMQALVNGASVSSVMPEYPTPVLWVLAIPYVVGAGTYTGFFYTFIGLFVAMDAAFTYLLWRTAAATGANPAFPIGFWCLFTVAMGEIVYMRLDLLPGLAGAAAILALIGSRGAASGVAIGVGASLKLWPAMLIPSTFTRSGWKKPLVSFAATGGALVLLSLVYGGWDRLISPLTWQSGRGLQIESVLATPAMIARLFDPQSYVVGISQYQAVEIFGPGVSHLLTIASVATVLGMVLIAALYILWIRRIDNRSIEQGATLMVIAIMIIIVTNKTFSTQYMIWLSGPVAALLCLPGARSQRHNVTLPQPRRASRQIAMWVLFLTAMTQIIFPTLYRFFVSYGPWTWVATVILVIRNLSMLAFTMWLTVGMAIRLFRRTAPVGWKQASDREQWTTESTKISVPTNG